MNKIISIIGTRPEAILVIKDLSKNFKIIEPVNHKETLELIKNTKLVVTDSGVVQREAFFMGVPLDVRLRKNMWEDEINVFGDGRAEEKIKKEFNWEPKINLKQGLIKTYEYWRTKNKDF